MRIFWSKAPPPVALYSELKSVNDLSEFSSKWEQASRMALGSDTCRHILQTALLNCGLERIGTELRNVHTGRRAVGSWWGWMGVTRNREVSISALQVSIQPHRRETHNFTKKKKSLLSFKMFYRQCNTILTEG